MKQGPKEPTLGKRIFVVSCFATALLSPLVWLYFIQFIGNPFALDSFTGKELSLCLLGMVAPMLCNILVWCLQGRLQGYRRGWLFAACCFVLSALCWVFTLGTNWFSWETATELGRINGQQRGRLCLCALIGLICALVPLIPTVVAAARSKGKDND